MKHGSLKPGERCPKCGKGKIYRINEPSVLVRITGQAPLQATVYERERWRCNLCGEVFTAEAPEGGPGRWDEGAASMVALLKYGTGMPFHRLEQLQKGLGIPLPASTQWEIKEAAEAIEPAWEELVPQAAQGEVLHNDDATAVILDTIRERAPTPWKGDTCIVPPFQGCCDRPLQPRAVVAARPSPWADLFRASGAKPRRTQRCHGCEDVTVFTARVSIDAMLASRRRPDSCNRER